MKRKISTVKTIGGGLPVNSSTGRFRIDIGHKVTKMILRSVSMFIPSLTSTSAVTQGIYMIKMPGLYPQDDGIIAHMPATFYNGITVGPPVDNEPSSYTLGFHNDVTVEFQLGGPINISGQYEITVCDIGGDPVTDTSDGIIVAVTLEFIDDSDS